MEKLNICLISLTFAPDIQDGSAKFFRGIFDYLKKHNHNVKVITGYWNLNLNNSDINQLKLIKKSYFWIPQFYEKVKRFLKHNEFDIIHGNGPKGSIPLIFPANKRFISTIHDLGPFETKYSILPIEKYLFKQVAKKADIITTCSESIKENIGKYVPKINHNKIFNLYSAIEEKFKPYPNEAQKLKTQLGINGPIISYIGRIALYKDVDSIIKAYRIAKQRVRDLNLVIGGMPDFFMRKYYREWKKKYKDIHFTGFIPEEKIPIYYSMGDIYISYSYASEGFGLTPIEAIACGTPVICSSIPAYKEILQDNAIFVPPKNPRLLANEILNLINNKEKRNLLLEKAQKFIKLYTWNSVGEKLEKLYNLYIND